MKLLILPLLVCSTLFALISDFKHDDYQIVIGGHFDDEALDIVENHDHTVSLVGYSTHNTSKALHSASYHNAFDYLASVNENNGEQLRLIRLDGSAQIVNDHNFTLSSYNRGTAILKRSDNGYLLGGYTHNGQMLIGTLDTDNKQGYLHQFGTANFDQLHALIKMDDGGSLAIGTSQTSRNRHDDIFVQGLGRSDIYLVRFDRNGQILWKKKYGSSRKDVGEDAVLTNDGGFILLGTTQEADYSELTVSKINDTGNTVWMKSFEKPGKNKAYRIIKTVLGDYLILAGFENKNAQKNIRMIKIDAEGNLLWEKSYFSNADEQLLDIATDLQGNMIGVGYRRDDARSDIDGLVRYFDNKGDLIWERKFGKERHDSFKTVSLLHDNRFVIAGFTNSFADKQRQIWVLKLNDDGSIAKKRQPSYDDVYQGLRQDLDLGSSSVQMNSQTAFSLFKETDSYRSQTKPSKDHHDDIRLFKDLRISHDALVFAQGSSVLTPLHKKTLEEFIPRLINALLPYKQRIKNIKIKGHTSTEWNAPDTQRYLNNARLSADRAMSVLSYSYQIDRVKEHQQWMSEIFSTDGYAYSDLIYVNDKENSIRSRRVEFEIILN